MMNKVMLIGNLGADPDVKLTANGTSVATVRLAVKRRRKEDGCDWLTVVCWGKLAETVGRYLHKGDKCAVAGWLQSRSYQAQDGSKRYVTEVVADEVEFLGKPLDGSCDGSSDGSSSGDFALVEDDELPW